MVVVVLPATVFAADIVASGYCGGEGDGSNLTWKLDVFGTLTISGKGKMQNGQPWKPSEFTIKSVIISDGVTYLGDHAFNGCGDLRSISIPDSVVSIGDRVFAQSGRLTDIIIPDSVAQMGEYSFFECYRLTNVQLSNQIEMIGDATFASCGSLTNIDIPEGVTNIGASAFYGCGSLTNIDIPDSVTSIGNFAFYECNGLTDINIPDGITNIASHAFHGCSSLTNIDIPDSVTNIGASAFYGCGSLTNIDIPDSVTNIGASAFYGCGSLTNIDIPDSITSIEYHTFRGCGSLMNIGIPEGVINIRYEAFYGCGNLTNVTIPDSVKKIEFRVFGECTKLTDVYFCGNIPSEWTTIPSVFPETVTIYYPEGNTSGWTSPTWTAPDGTVYNTATFVPEAEPEYAVTQYLEVSINNPSQTYYVGEEICILLTDITKTHDFGSSEANIQCTKPQNLLLTNSNDKVIKLKSYDDFGYDSTHIEYSFTAEKVGTTVISIDDDLNEETLHIPITVTEDKYQSVRADSVPIYPYEMLGVKDEYNGYVNGVYIADFKYTKNADETWQFTFNAYNQLYIPAVVEVFDADGNLLKVELISKYSNMTSLKDVYDITGQIFSEVTKGDMLTFRDVCYAKETPISVSVPQDGYIRITNSSSISTSCLFVNMFDYVLTGLGLVENVYDFDTTTKDSITKEVLLAVLSKEFSSDLLKKIQKDINSTILNKFSEEGIISYFHIMSGNLAGFLKELDLDLLEIAKGSAAGVAWGNIQGFIEKYGGPAGLTLNGLFTFRKAADFICQSKHFAECSKSVNGTGVMTPTDRSYRELTSFEGTRVTSDSEFPDETILQVFKLTDNEEVESIESTADYELYEISLQVDGEDYQPDKPVTVYLRKPYSFSENMKLYRQNEDGEWEEIQYMLENGMLVFQIDHFCLFAIINQNKSGDVNFDGDVNETDYDILIKYLSGRSKYEIVIVPDTAAADLNDDGRVTRADAMILARYLAKWPGYAEKYFQ